MNIELENGVYISNVNQFACGYSTTKENQFTKINGGLKDIVSVLKNNKNLKQFDISIYVSENSSNTLSHICIPIKTIATISDEKYNILYDKEIDNSL